MTDASINSLLNYTQDPQCQLVHIDLKENKNLSLACATEIQANLLKLVAVKEPISGSSHGRSKRKISALT